MHKKKIRTSKLMRKEHKRHLFEICMYVIEQRNVTRSTIARTP